MLKQIRIHNYKCFVDFRLDLPRMCAIVGNNGSGKTTLWEVLAALQDVIVRNSDVTNAFPASTLTRWLANEPVQRFGLDLQVGENIFRYDLELVHDIESRRVTIRRERLECANVALYVNADGHVDVLGAADEAPHRFPFPRSLSFLPMLEAGRNAPRAVTFRDTIADTWLFSPDPREIESTTTGDALWLDRNGKNFVSWLRGVLAERPEVIRPLLKDLKPAMPGLKTITFESINSTVRELMFIFNADGREYRLPVNRLSDGQRMLLLLYGFVRGSADRSAITFIDEPETGLAPHEMQPLISTMTTAIEDHRGQALVISHHPEYIDYLAGWGTIQFRRPRGGPVMTTEITAETTGGRLVSEWLSRPWAYDDEEEEHEEQPAA